MTLGPYISQFLAHHTFLLNLSAECLEENNLRRLLDIKCNSLCDHYSLALIQKSPVPWAVNFITLVEDSFLIIIMDLICLLNVQ